ncbi:MAG: Hydrogenase maturation factor [Parcubacteria group bacterium GW2011_GWC2_44_17]|uniref:Hydrogenase assembly protein HypC n=1 Tax=Candidatus Jacksonbacteria bacterium RIFCSPLOWO2_02_FULL_44_20 TaxID=1798460 RepID=A0A1G2A9L1_9BACT|nr:MAG: Hydrogenase maturation factor [Parcubacteria group bacterium GW2011_GWC2_44_17]OGY69976.1 MAG: hypothetical protein A3C00_04330 [Candidatus Jacksonbacteria bacterium RIFCSPHIGHO2_02_FULL_44_25]OGY72658.1 MAG: hypothetical protein A3E05_02400 [Candidatus Jacksonbacteria bacterium RIFCSPHIGHO2_12_FULL_44_12]OGY73339.1 MAG: hypothetical protein A3H61_00245 [Candidatus Jacksonbacteria bacterium RIFCSPLOWO2_02_FULL_44_20]OGY74433.1 MAG: hypothetical protein A3H07_00260 [Candidatus Jacksonbac
MCLAIPGKIISIKNNIAQVKYSKETRSVKIVSGNYKIGDYVIAQARMIIEKVPKKQAMTWNEFLKAESL